jgi:N-dimethylarginine dimethylaminohydrolase
MKISSCNEYDKLVSCVVGDATDAQFPTLDKIFAYNKDVTAWTETPHPFGKFPEHIISEANEDLEILANTLKSFGVTVYRPDQLNHSQVVTTNNWSTDGMYNYCPRDVLLVIDDMVIEAPMVYRSRQHEALAYWSIKDAAIVDGTRWFSAPRPRLLTQDNFVRDGNIILNEREPMFDAANILRHNDDLLYLVSNSGNRLGAQWLQRMIGKKYRVHIVDNLYSYAHIDSTISVLRDGLVVLNGSRVNENNCPDLFKGWTKIYVNDVTPQSFYNYPYASKWIALNMLSVDPKTVIVDKNQSQLIKQLEQTGQTVVPLELRHSRTMGGGFHCVTLDLIRSS